MKWSAPLARSQYGCCRTCASAARTASAVALPAPSHSFPQKSVTWRRNHPLAWPLARLTSQAAMSTRKLYQQRSVPVTDLTLPFAPQALRVPIAGHGARSHHVRLAPHSRCIIPCCIQSGGKGCRLRHRHATPFKCKGRWAVLSPYPEHPVCMLLQQCAGTAWGAHCSLCRTSVMALHAPQAPGHSQ